MEFLREALGISRISVTGTADPLRTEIAGVAVASVRDASVRRLVMRMIAAGQPLDKEKIVREVWDLEYDPVIHDRKVYKLIEKAKALFGMPDLFLNTYGAYEINPAFFGRRYKA